MASENHAVSPTESDLAAEELGGLVSPPSLFTFESLAHLYQQYTDELVSREHLCPLGRRVIFANYHFFHLVKMKKGQQTAFKMAVEEALIKGISEGFGEYGIDTARAGQLAWLPDLIAAPTEIYEYADKKTADEVFIREYRRSGSPFKVFLCKREADYLLPITSMTVKRQGVKEHRRGKRLWPK
jgi:hypothetical protein